MGVEAKFKKGDFIINRSAGDIGVVSSVDKKNYYHFKHYYEGMAKRLKNLDKLAFTLQVNYQKFFDYCTDEEVNFMKEKLGKDGTR